MLGGVTYRHVKWLRNHEQRQRKVGRPSEGCPCYYVHCLTCKSSLALNGRNQNNMPVSFVCRRTSWLQSCFWMRGEEKQQVNGKKGEIFIQMGEGKRWRGEEVTSSECASLKSPASTDLSLGVKEADVFSGQFMTLNAALNATRRITRKLL